MCHKDLGIILSSDLSWNNHYKSITAHAYKVLSLIHRTILPNHSTTTMVKLYVSLIRSQLLYCTQIWRPHLMKDILTIERVQRHATKYILNDFTSCYKTRLLKLNLLSLLYMFELQDLLFTIKSIKSELVNSTLITTLNSVPLALDQEPAINSYHLVTLTIHLVIPIFTVYHIYGTLCLLLT